MYFVVRTTLKACIHFILGLTILGLISSCSPKAGDECGFVQNVYGQRISWKSNLPAAVLISTGVPAELKSAIYRAAATWEKKLGQQAFVLTEENLQSAAQTSAPGRDKKNGIYFLNNWESDKKSEQGRTSVYWAGEEIQEADIRINAADFSFYNEDQKQLVRATNSSNDVQKTPSGYNFEALMLHEMGHFLGLKHREEKGSVMATYLSAFQDRTEPASLDTENVQCEYK